MLQANAIPTTPLLFGALPTAPCNKVDLAIEAQLNALAA
jgi:hypothetical protein